MTQSTGSFVTRVWRQGLGPALAHLRGDVLYDITSKAAPTMRDLLELPDIAAHLAQVTAEPIGRLDDLTAASTEASGDVTRLLSPADLQAIKACGVTFARSMIERVIEERAAGDAKKADEIRDKIKTGIGTDIASIKPGSAQAEELKAMLKAEGLWSQYLEVGIGPYAEVFTKAQPLSSVGIGAEVGILTVSSWNNPEPETVLLVDAKGKVVGVTLGNDVNLRDIEGRSALLLGKAKDNNASCAIGPFIRLFDASFTIDHVRNQEVGLTVEGDDGFKLAEASYMKKISRDVLDLVGQTINENHQYPDGIALFTGTLFAPTQDRGGKGMGFTHKIGDTVRIHSEKLGVLQNRVTYCHQAPAWEFGISALMKNLSQRGLL